MLWRHREQARSHIGFGVFSEVTLLQLSHRPNWAFFLQRLPGILGCLFSPGVARLYAPRPDSPSSDLPAPTGLC
ncbi:hypothetical protein EMIT0P176_30252 [Pseudomonas sp. IT-P176]